MSATIDRPTRPPLLATFAAAAGTGLWFGLVGGLLEVTAAGVRRLFLGKLVFVPEFYWWAAPLASAVMGGLLVGALGTLASVISPASARRIRYGLGVALVAVSLLLLVGGLHRGAALLLGLGFGARIGSWAADRMARLDRWLAMSFPVILLGGPLLAAVTFRLPSRGGEPGAGPGPDLPNVLLIVLDTVRAIELSLYGAPWKTTPSIDRFAGGGVTFERASSTAPWTAPSHASLFTGEWADDLAIDWYRPLDRQRPTLAEALATAGFRTGGFVANTEYASEETGLARGFATYRDHALSPIEVARMPRLARVIVDGARRLGPGARDLPGRLDGEVINRRFLRWLDEPATRPFFAFLNYYDAHAPYYPPQPYWERWLPGTPRTPLDNSPRTSWPAADAEQQRRAYAAALAYLDSRVGALLDTLRARGVLERTLVIITSDHGEEFNEHGVMGHGHTLHRPSIHVPLIIRGPGATVAGCRVATPVSIRDIPATVIDLLGLAARFPGSPLAGRWRSGDSAGTEVIRTQVDQSKNLPERYPVSGGPISAAERGRYRVIQEPGRHLLFDLVADPMELTDLSTDAARQPILDALLAALPDGRGRRTGPPVAVPDSVWAQGLPTGCLTISQEEGRP